MIAVSKADTRVFFWIAAEAGLRAGELAGLRLNDATPNSITVCQAVWNGKVGTPKTDSALRTIAVSPQLALLLSEQIERQKAMSSRASERVQTHVSRGIWAPYRRLQGG